MSRFSFAATPKGLHFQEVIDTLHKTPGVLRVHNVRLWALSMDKIALCAHVVVGKFCFHTFYTIKSNKMGI
jgi:Co/Zn/Cd efflux system component